MHAIGKRRATPPLCSERGGTEVKCHQRTHRIRGSQDLPRVNNSVAVGRSSVGFRALFERSLANRLGGDGSISICELSELLAMGCPELAPRYGGWTTFWKIRVRCTGND